MHLRTLDARRAGLYRPSHNDAGTNVTGGLAPMRGVGRSDNVWVRRWALVALVAQVAFVGSWLIAASWQGPRYSVLDHSISDMYAVGAPNGAFLVVVLTLCGAATILFAWLSLRIARLAYGFDPAMQDAVSRRVNDSCKVGCR